MAIQVDEYRNGKLIGFVRRNLQINVVANCNALPPGFANLQAVPLPGGGTGAGIAATAGDTVVRLYFTQKMQCGSAVPDDLRLTGPDGLPNPVVDIIPLNCLNGITDSMDVRFLNGLEPGMSFLYSKKGVDGNTLAAECGDELAEHDTILIWVPDTITGVGSGAQAGNLNFQVEPNPASGWLWIRYVLDESRPGTFGLYDLELRKVLEVQLPRGSSELRIRLPEGLQGHYHVVLTSGTRRAAQKLTVLKDR
jgi:hypothetical protein